MLPLTLYFAVLDGADPAAWQPWNGESKTFSAICNELDTLLSARGVDKIEPKVGFQAMIAPVSEILQSQRLHGVVGTIIDATADPTDHEFYDKKIAQLEQLCLRIRDAAKPARRLIAKTKQFDIWFVTNGFEIEALSQWADRARNTVQFVLRERPRIDYIPEGALFPLAVRGFLAGSRHALVWVED